MHIELVESLRCPQAHEDTWLVASVTRFDGRDIVAGTLGCPVCRRQYRIESGEVDFTASRLVPPDTPTDARGRVEMDEGEAPFAVDEAHEMLRTRALLGLSDDATGVVLLGGRHGVIAEALADVVRVAPIRLNAPSWMRARSPHVSSIRTDGTIPLAAGAVRAARLDPSTGSAPMLVAIVPTLAPGARVVAPAATPVPAGLVELARDEREWVAERPNEGAAGAPVPLRRRQARTPSS